MAVETDTDPETGAATQSTTTLSALIHAGQADKRKHPLLALAMRTANIAAELACGNAPSDAYPGAVRSRLARILELSETEAGAVRVEADPHADLYGGKHRSLRLAAPLGDGDLIVVTASDEGEIFHLAARCPGCAQIVPSFEFNTLTGLGSALCWLAEDCEFPIEPVPFSRHRNIRQQHAPGCVEPDRLGWRDR